MFSSIVPLSNYVETTIHINRLDLPAELSHVDVVRAAFMESLDTWFVPEQSCRELKLMVTEAWTNAVLHGACEDSTLSIRVEWWREENTVVFAITDPGKGPQGASYQNLRTPKRLDEYAPRGLFLIHQLCDHWEHWASECGYRLLLKKQIVGMPTAVPQAAIVQSLTDELSVCYESLAAFYRLGRRMVKQGALTEFVGHVFDILKTGQDFSDLRLIFSAATTLRVKEMLRSIKEVDQGAMDSILMRRVLNDKIERLWSHHGELDASDRAYYPEQGCMVPVQINEQVSACLLIGRSAGSQAFAASDLSKLRTFAEILGMAITQACLRYERDHHQRALREFELATDIERKLLPIRTPAHVEGYQVCIRHYSADQVSGDYVELLPLADGRWLGTIIDVMGKGVSAALLAAIYRTLFLAHASANPSDLGEMMMSMNRTLSQQFGGLGHFITSTLIRLDVQEHCVEIVNAGHCPAVLIRKHGLIDLLKASGPPLGLFSGASYVSDKRILAEDDSLYLFTDGCYEWHQRSNLFGWDRLVNLAYSMREGQANAFWERLQKMIAEHVAPSQRKDDETLMCLKRKKS